MKKISSLIIEPLKNYLPLKGYFIKNKWALILGFTSLIATDFFQLMIPLVIKRAIDALTLKTATSEVFLNYGIMIVLLACGVALFRYTWRMLLFGFSRKIEEGLRNELYNTLQSLSLTFYRRTKTGDIMARSINDINAVRMATGMGIVGFVDGIVMGVAAIGFMIYIHPLLTLISILPAPLLIYFSRHLTRRMAVGHERVQKTFSDLTERVREAFAGIRIIKAYAREDWTYERVREEGENYVSANLGLARNFAFFMPMMMAFSNIGLVIVIWFGGRLTILSQISTGEFVAFISYLNLLTWPMLAIGWVTNLLQRGSASMKRVKRILDEVPEIKDPEKPGEAVPVQGDIRLEGITYSYSGQSGEALKDVNIEIKQGEYLALVGRVGSGKTTFLSMIPRLLEPSKGSVLVDGVNVREMPLKNLRESIGFVTQETIIFSDTIRNNILFGRDVPEGVLKEALEASGFLNEVLELENGFDTLLGERGLTLSGGQRQRLTLARALISDPAILILDDALSMVDTRTEEHILNSILDIRKGKTSLIVSHRPSTIRKADRIVVLDQGKIIGIGNHDTLMEQRNEYAQIYNREQLVAELENNLK